MEMLLLGACMSLFGVAVACMAFGAATADADQKVEVMAEAPVVQPAIQVATAQPARFFRDQPVVQMSHGVQIPLDALLAQIENHVRLEQAAAESFLAMPSSTLLHSRTISTLVN